MAFKRRETVIEAIDLNAVAADDAERRIIAGVKKYATNETNWSNADSNTTYLGHIIGMGIESSNLADITMSIERQFLTRKTRRVPAADGGNDFKLEDGELGKLRILDGQDSLAATAGLSIKMLMDLGHMPADPAYLEKVIPYADIVTIGEAYRLNDALRKTIARAEKLSGTERDDALANLRSLLQQAKTSLDLTADPRKLAQSRRTVYEADKTAHDALASELSIAGEKLKGATSTNDQAQVAKLQSEVAEIKTRLRLSAQKVRISAESVAAGERRSPVTAGKYQEIAGILTETSQSSQQLTP